MVYFGLSKKDKLRYCPRSIVITVYRNLILPFCVFLLFLLRPTYNIFRSENLQNDRVHRCLRHSIFFIFFLKCLYSNFVKFKEEEKRTGSLVPEHHLKFLRFISTRFVSLQV
jgi:hypothetical protein